MTEPAEHPYFNSRRAAPWFRTLADGLAAARATDRRVFVQVGRLSCGGSRALIEKTVIKEEISEFLNQHFVCVGINTEAMDPDVAALMPLLPRHEPTPLCIYLDAEGRTLHSTVGGRPAAVFLRDMTEALSRPPATGG